MKLESILDQLNSLEKNSFIKIIDSIINDSPKNIKKIEKIISNTDASDLKNLDNLIICQIFSLIEREFLSFLKTEFLSTDSQLDILTDLLIRDGNCVIKREWFSRLYETELKELKKSIQDLKKDIDNPKSDITEDRKRDYQIYLSCVDIAFNNDVKNNRDAKITNDELSILINLGQQLELSQEEIKLLNYSVLKPKKLEIDGVINELKNIGVLFYSKKHRKILVSDEMVRMLRTIRGKEIADKYFRRVLRAINEPRINLACRKHNIAWKNSYNQKTKDIIKEGISLRAFLKKDIHKPDVNTSDRKKYLNEIWAKGFNKEGHLKGNTLDEKIDAMIDYFNELETDKKVSISVDGYGKLLVDLSSSVKRLNKLVQSEFYMEEDHVLSSDFLLQFNIKPQDILNLVEPEELAIFIKANGIKSRGNDIQNILDAYKDTQNIFIENFENIAFRDLKALKENDISIKESDLGVKFESITKAIFGQLGLNIDDDLRKELNTKKDKIDILINLGNNDIIIVECKTIKGSGYNKFSSVSRQLKSYISLAKSNGYQVLKTLLIAPEFSDEFINDTELDYDLNLSLIQASSLLKILEGFKKNKKIKTFPYKLLMRDVLIKEDRIIKAIS